MINKVLDLLLEYKFRIAFEATGMNGVCYKSCRSREFRVRLLAMCRGELPAVFAQLSYCEI